jgi:hypothetical protein
MPLLRQTGSMPAAVPTGATSVEPSFNYRTRWRAAQAGGEEAA